ncbi:hypothetical protein [Clostridium akagii]|uniref:hypothetical protein n=1 Tax=Clostridium akagii TaxID=91623 RepID=UPI000B247D27|nr:hypothetical protein [Clostridium akagii]
MDAVVKKVHSTELEELIKELSKIGFNQLSKDDINKIIANIKSENRKRNKAS